MLNYYLQLSLSRFRRDPLIMVLIVLTMAIGIAACITSLTIFTALESEPITGVSNHLYVVTMNASESTSNTPYENPDSLLKLRDARALVDFRATNQQFALAYSSTTIMGPNQDLSETVTGIMTYGPALRVLSVPLRAGSRWTAQERTSHTPVVIIDERLAEKLFGTAAAAVGRTVKLDKRLFHVIGVSATWTPRTQFPVIGTGGIAQHIRFFVPIGAALDAGIGPTDSGECGGPAHTTFGSVDLQRCRWLEVWAMLKTPNQLRIYTQYLGNYALTQHDAGRFVNAPEAKLYATPAWMAIHQVVSNQVALNVVLASAFLVLCLINAAGLLTARFLRRQADVAIRRALGASWRQVFAQHLVEASLLGLLGGALALPLTLFGMWVVRKQPVSYAPAAQFNLHAFLGLTLLSLLIGMLAGLLPAWRVCQLPPATQIKQA